MNKRSLGKGGLEVSELGLWVAWSDFLLGKVGRGRCRDQLGFDFCFFRLGSRIVEADFRFLWQLFG